MALTMYRLSVPTFVHGFAVLGKLLDKAEVHAKETGLSLDDLVNARLTADMLPLSGQVQRASDTSKGTIARLTDLQVPGFPDEEKTFAELRERIGKTVTFLETVRPADLEGSETREVTLNFTKLKMTLSGEDYLLKFVLPNFYFHLTTAYDILRHKGVPVGKADFINLS
ncbi:hypothetical protein B0E45_20930 [Sinorhizobium sp. A49]|uniref:DUF1993 domain-containing protein n=1 Tax=Sinorhizobium sp. A49 TaxID=1945861 RepID=UPI00098581BF|nr:DUF1993 domain-containing protein [Sinorhizobium sp. A49]OOG67868.1 hypothetical protein B0E45_20930 [Sinorhizobium sp. A49]